MTIFLPCVLIPSTLAMNYVVDSAEFGDRWTTMSFTVSVNSTVLFLYALYVVLFIFSIHTLQRRVPGRKFLVGTAWVMFLLATTGTIIVISTTAISMRMVSLFVQGDPDSPARLLRLYQSLALGQDIILAINNLVTDLLFLYRCYVIWGARRTVLLLPVMMILATMTVGCITGLGYYGVVKLPFFVDPRVPFIMGASTNVVLMGLTAGRIWYIRREAGAITGQHSLRQRYGTAVAIILESGFLYCICVIFYEISMSMKDSSVYASPTDYCTAPINNMGQGTISIGVAWGLVQVGVNIVPTLILVRVGLGRSTENGLHVRPSFDSSTTESTRPFKEGEAFAGQMKFREISGDC